MPVGSIRQQHCWLVHQSPRDSDALLLPAGKLAGKMPGTFCGQPNDFKGFQCPFPGSRAVMPFVAGTTSATPHSPLPPYARAD